MLGHSICGCLFGCTAVYFCVSSTSGNQFGLPLTEKTERKDSSIGFVINWEAKNLTTDEQGKITMLIKPIKTIKYPLNQYLWVTDGQHCNEKFLGLLLAETACCFDSKNKLFCINHLSCISFSQKPINGLLVFPNLEVLD